MVSRCNWLSICYWLILTTLFLSVTKFAVTDSFYSKFSKLQTTILAFNKNILATQSKICVGSYELTMKSLTFQNKKHPQSKMRFISFNSDKTSLCIESLSSRILTGKKHPKIKLQRLRKKRILTFGSLVHQINSF